MEIKIQPIGIINSPYKFQESTPRQGPYSKKIVLSLFLMSLKLDWKV